jgi:hypothetical protein
MLILFLRTQKQQLSLEIIRKYFSKMQKKTILYIQIHRIVEPEPQPEPQPEPEPEPEPDEPDRDGDENNAD